MVNQGRVTRLAQRDDDRLLTERGPQPAGQEIDGVRAVRVRDGPQIERVARRIVTGHGVGEVRLHEGDDRARRPYRHAVVRAAFAAAPADHGIGPIPGQVAVHPVTKPVERHIRVGAGPGRHKGVVAPQPGRDRGRIGIRVGDPDLAPGDEVDKHEIRGVKAEFIAYRRRAGGVNGVVTGRRPRVKVRDAVGERQVVRADAGWREVHRHIHPRRQVDGRDGGEDIGVAVIGGELPAVQGDGEIVFVV